MKMTRPILFLLLFLPFCAGAQKYTIHGVIRDKASGESLIAAGVYDRNSLAGANTNSYGFYSLTLPAGKVRLRYFYLGYEDVLLEFELNRDTTLDVRLSAGVQLQEVEITAGREESIERTTRMSKVDLPVDQIKKVPALLGEVDVLKALQLLPGVSGGNEGTSGIYVRGGSPDQNLILLDGTPVYNVFHLGGIFSVFNADALRNVTLTKGGFPARFGGRLSSVLELNMKEGNMNEFKGEGGLGLISSRATFEGPIVKDKASFMISGRRTYLDVVTAPIFAAVQSDSQDLGLKLYFYDLNAKMNWTVNSKHRLYLSGYFGQDVFGADFSEREQNGASSSFDNGLDWGNVTTSFRWNYSISPRLFANTSIHYSRYQFNIRSAFENKRPPDRQKFSASYFSGIQDYSVRTDFDYTPSPFHSIKFGAGTTRHRYSPGASQYDLSFSDVVIDTTLGDKPVWATESYLYFEDDMKFGRWGLNAGLHASSFYVQQKTYPSLQPRLSARYFLTNQTTLKASFATMTQFINLLSNEGAGLPSDLWLPSTRRIRPQESWQAALGAARVLKGEYELSAEAYYKSMNNVISYREGASFLFSNEGWEDKITQGRGEAYGLELFVQKKKGKLNGWIGYTLSWNYRQFDEINSGRKYRFRYDRRHDFEIVANYELNPRWSISATWQFATGNAITLPLLKYQTIDNTGWGITPVEVTGNKNAATMPAFHKLDLGAEYKLKKRGFIQHSLVFSVYNAYARANPFYIVTDQDYDPKTGQNKTVFKQVSILPLIPNVSYQFKF